MPGKMVESIANVPKKGLLIIEEALHAYATHQQEYVLINEGKKLKQWFSFLQKEVPDAYAILSAAVQGNIEQLKAFWSFADFAGGSLLMVTLDEPDEPTRALLRRFSNVFGLAYRRFADLKQAEAQAREAQIEAALEKVRSRTLAMQKSDELAGTAAVLFQQLIVLGIAPNRLFIILIKEDMPQMEAWLTDEDGSKVSMGFTGNYLKNASLLKMYEGWKAKRKTLVIDMQGAELQQYFHYLHDELNVPFKGGLEQKRRVQHLAYFSHGMIGMASPDEQPVETLELLERFAAVFNLTFTRFNDLKIAEAHALQAEQDLIAIKEAKQKAELALTELQATQKQLVQSEKMASLGELTAGIAHEIQNPLNFVNNFSEVSKELLDEMREAIEKGDHEEAREIMEDVIRNLEKINHHGKRADGIVKGMLQHSRSSSGQREKTDINDLCDEYLRLAYHGLRAKDKSFNAHFETELDPEIGLVEVIPQEIGRVVLNLINNAFYAVNARKKSAASGYVPTVKIATAKQQDKIEIRVADNGTGIPASVKEKIFQPFFTTKPTGQGTGLGLSLSYDIVKAHGGELRVDTKEKVGTTFIIQIPFT
jgi:signal transduction histidine kinase